jgi:hypothetical protein
MVVQFYFFYEAYDGVLGNQRIDINIDYFEHAWNDSSLNKHLIAIDRLIFNYDSFQLFQDLQVAFVFIEFDVKANVTVHLFDQCFQPIADAIDACLVFQKAFGILFDVIAQIMISLQHCE